MNSILEISKQIKWKVEVLIDNIFILAFLHIFRTNLFVREILFTREVRWITTFVKIPVFVVNCDPDNLQGNFFYIQLE